MIQVYTGDGKGKTTAAVGQGLRAAGHGMRVFLLQFMKGDPGYGELKALARVERFRWEQSGLPTFVEKGNPGPEDLRLARAGLARARALLSSGECDMLILDEINCAVDYGLLGVDEVVELVEMTPDSMDLVLTGRNAPAEILHRADLVSEVREVKHPFRRGAKARAGIEY